MPVRLAQAEGWVARGSHMSPPHGTDMMRAGGPCWTHHHAPHAWHGCSSQLGLLFPLLLPWALVHRGVQLLLQAHVHVCRTKGRCRAQSSQFTHCAPMCDLDLVQVLQCTKQTAQRRRAAQQGSLCGRLQRKRAVQQSRRVRQRWHPEQRLSGSSFHRLGPTCELQALRAAHDVKRLRLGQSRVKSRKPCGLQASHTPGQPTPEGLAAANILGWTGNVDDCIRRVVDHCRPLPFLLLGCSVVAGRCTICALG